MDIFEYAKQLKELMGKTMSVNAHTNMLWHMADFILKRQWNRKGPPEIEKPVLVIVEHVYIGRKPQRSVVRAFYEDGTLQGRLSRYFWDISNEAMIPKGWYEISDYGDASYVIDDPIVGWQNLSDPWE